mmetsp:Transcript_59258/g.105306  ORF Transcript_59258/g.105306 Transcript_59258/m.105306 type:complete len:361 (+) Transcript_59258:141-1223(+)
MPDLLNASLSRLEFNASLSRPKLDATLVLENEEPEKKHQQQAALFSLASLNTRTAPSAEVCWSQLLALSLAHEDEPVLSVGRHKDCWVRLADPRVSVNHFDIIARREAGGIGVHELSYECFLKDRSSNGTCVNGIVVGKGSSVQLRSGDEICVLPASRVGTAEMVCFLFRNTTETLSTPEGVEALALDIEELVLCPICMQAIYKCVALAPCSHNFCMACCSDWMRRKSDCPVCRRPITAVMKNHPMDSVVEAFLSAHPSRRRTPLELRDMDARDELRLGASGKLVRDICTMVSPAAAIPAPTAAPSPAPAPAAAVPTSARSNATASGAASGTRGTAASDAEGVPAPAAHRNLGSQVCTIQ